MVYNNKTKKEQIRDFKKKADAKNSSLYLDIASFKKGFVLILCIVSIILLFFWFLN